MKIAFLPLMNFIYFVCSAYIRPYFDKKKHISNIIACFYPLLEKNVRLTPSKAAVCENKKASRHPDTLL